MVEVAVLLNVVQGLLWLLVGGYFLAFRPLERRVFWLGLTAVLFGLGSMAWQYTVVTYSTWILATAALLVFTFLFPQRIRWGSPAGAAWILAASMLVVTTVYYFVSRTPIPGQTTLEVGLADRLFAPFSLGTATTLVLLVLGRLLDLRDPQTLDRERQAAPYLLLLFTAGVITGGGFELGHVLGGLLGRTDFPSFFYKTPAGVAYTVAASLAWWVWPSLVALYGAIRLRWWVPAALMSAGFLSYIPIILQPGLDPRVIIPLRLWGNLVAPALVMYAQARWAPFAGEPARASSGWVMAAFAGVVAYAFVAIAVVAIAGASTAGQVIGPLLGLAAAIGMAALVLPQTRRLHLQRLFSLAAHDQFKPGTVVLGRYRITRLLGEGGQGRVYEATDRKNGNARVVLKAVTSDDALHEARILKGLVHPNIVRFVDVVEVPGFTLLVLEFAEGGTLRGLLSRSGRLPGAEAVAMVDGILSGLSQAHAQGVAHRDLKPENILLADGVPKLADFGVAHPSGPTGQGTTMRVGGRGTLAYLAPEQVRGAVGDARSDVYAMGVLVHEVLTGRPPIATGEDDFLVRQSILTKPPNVQLPPAQKGIAAVLRRALEKDPSARYGDAAELRAHLKAAWSA